MSRLRLTQVHKYYGAVHAVRGIDLTINDGEFVVLVGPSGCGKSTLLRAIAGLEDIDQGTIAIADRVVNGVRPRDRDIAMVFQNYALYPYLSVFDNIAFGLRARKTPEPDVKTRVQAVAEMLGIAELLQRRPRQLSGGQRQRVAMGRAIVRDARLYLFDEPLSNLDAKLREEMRSEIKRLHQDIGKTMVYVTHDQVEAMTLADRIVLLRDGQIEQVGAPLELFEQPVSRFVASFLGSPTISFVPATLCDDDGVLSLLFNDRQRLPLPTSRRASLADWIGRELLFGVRPEHLQRARAGADGLPRLDVTIDLVQPTGSRSYATFNLAGTPVVAELQAHDAERAGQNLSLAVMIDRTLLVDPQTDRTL